jgi:hypothetical protein
MLLSDKTQWIVIVFLSGAEIQAKVGQNTVTQIREFSSTIELHFEDGTTSTFQKSNLAGWRS